MQSKVLHITSHSRTSETGVCSGITYRCSDGNIEGIANTIHRVLSDESYGQEAQVRKLLKLREGDTLLQIDSFHPNGISYSETEMRKGRGTEFLEEIEKEARDIGAKGIYTWALTDYMKNFAEKHGFETYQQGIVPIREDSQKHYLCVKPLGESTIKEEKLIIDVSHPFQTRPEITKYTLNRNPKTYVDVVRRNVGSFKMADIYEDEEYPLMHNTYGLKDTDEIWQLGSFFPYGTGIPDNDSSMGQGHGVQVLEKIIQDALTAGVKGLYLVTTGRPGMLRFLDKHGFIEIEKGEANYFKLIKKEATS